MSKENTDQPNQIPEQQMQILPSPQVLVSSLRELTGAPDPYGGFPEVSKSYSKVSEFSEKLAAAMTDKDFMAIRINLANLLYEGVGMTLAAGCNFDRDFQASAYLRESVFDLNEEQVNATADEYRKFGIESRIEEVGVGNNTDAKFYRIFAVLPPEVTQVEITSGPFSGVKVVDGQFLPSLRSTKTINPYLSPSELFLKQCGYRYDAEKAEAELLEYKAKVASEKTNEAEASK